MYQSKNAEDGEAHEDEGSVLAEIYSGLTLVQQMTLPRIAQSMQASSQYTRDLERLTPRAH